MKNHLSSIALATFTAAGALFGAGPVAAQIAGGSTTVDTSVTSITTMATGWSVKNTLMGKTLYNDAGQKVGKVEVLIISPERNVSYVIVGAGGFVGIGRHDVAIPVTHIQDRAGILVISGATQDTIKGMPEFTYAADTTKRDAFVAAADKDVAQGKATVASLERKAGAADAKAKSKIDLDITALQAEVKSAEAKLAELKQANAARWRDFEVEVRVATARLRKSVQRVAG